MACAYPQWRIPADALVNHPLYWQYKGRIHNKGVIIQRPEWECLKKTYPTVADKTDQIPCGKCIQCRLAYSRDWANRCMLELKTSKNAAFLTLTYDDANLEFAPYVDPETGEVGYRPCLVPDHFTKFMKRLRLWCSEYQEEPVRFFACGEYGDESQRPHYHVILFNLPQEFYAESNLFTAQGVVPPLWTCRALRKLWRFGMSVYGDVNWSTCAYVARYVVKKRKGKDRALQHDMQQLFFPDFPWPEEFVRMSRRPGLAREYYDQHKNVIYMTDEIFVPVKDCVQSVRPVKYYDRLYDIDNPDHLKRIRADRKQYAEQLSVDALSNTDLNEVEYLDLKHQSKLDQAKKLIRPSV